MTESFVKHDGPAPSNQDRRRSEASVANLRFEHGTDAIESGARHSDRGGISRPKLSDRRGDRQEENHTIPANESHGLYQNRF